MTDTTMTKAAELTAEPTFDSQGRPALAVALSGSTGQGHVALVDEEGLERLREAGARRLYLVDDGTGRAYVTFVSFRERTKFRAMSAARCIAGNPRGRRVEFLSGDRLDLRRTNLWARNYSGVGEGCATVGQPQ